MKNTIHLRHPGALSFAVDRLGIVCSVALPTRDQMRRVFERGPEPDETESAADLDRRRADELAIFCEGTDVPVGQLNAEEEIQIIQAIVAAHHGFDPADAAAAQFLSLKKKALLAGAQIASELSTTPPSNSPQS
jgi:hypothetical protein